jgi:cobalamin biosynthesis Mg chelatase CobN
MLGTRRHLPDSSGHSIRGLLSVLALLALACFVPVAQASAEDNAGIEYRDAPPTATGNQIPGGGSEAPATNSKAHGTNATGGSTGTNPSGEGSGGEHSGSGGVAGTGAGGSGGNGSGTGQGNAASAGSAGVGSAAAIPGTQAASKEDGGSSPLVPILIAVAVLMAGAVATVVIRQRRQRRGPDAQVSPEAS